jgi:pyruvate formate lyase activating enzyme
MTAIMTDGRDIYGFIFNIEHYHIHDGSGIRTNVFFKGCHLKCPWCCNPESQKREKECGVHKNLCKSCLRCIDACPKGAISFREGNLVLDRELCDACGICADKCLNRARQIYGRQVTLDDVMTEIEKDEMFYRRSGGGVTLSGGEPSLQPEFAMEILKLCNERCISTAVETSGAVPWDSLWKTVEYADEILFDIKYTDPDLFSTICPVPLDTVRENIAKLKERNKNVVFRCPLIPGHNDNMEHIQNIIKWAREFGIAQIDLLPFHQYGRHMYHSLDMPYKLETLTPLDDSWVRDIEKIMAEAGFKVSIGG